MTLYRLYLRSRVHREFASPRRRDSAPTSADSLDAGRQECPTMVCDERRYSYVISGREEFEAENDAAALAIAHCIRNAADDLCDAFELWEGTRQIDQGRIVPLPAAAVFMQRQDTIVRTEEALLNSRWAIARSRGLLARLKELRSPAGEPALAQS